MSDVTKALPGVEISLGGQKKKLIFTMRAFMLVEKVTGKNALDGELFSPPSATTIVSLVWAALQHKQEGGALDLAIEDVAEMLTVADIGVVSEAIQKAFNEASAPKNESPAT